MPIMNIGVTKANEGIEGISWNILGQIYVPKQHSENSLSWHATFPVGTFVPPHIHPTQDEFVYMLQGRLDVLLDGQEGFAEPGDLVRLPKGIAHGLFNKTDFGREVLLLGLPGAAALRPVLGAAQSGAAGRSGRSGRHLGAPRGRFPATARGRVKPG